MYHHAGVGTARVPCLLQAAASDAVASLVVVEVGEVGEVVSARQHVACACPQWGGVITAVAAAGWHLSVLSGCMPCSAVPSAAVHERALRSTCAPFACG